MLAGLIFTTEDADDRPGTLAGTLPFGGLTLVEFQARLLAAAGATQIILVVSRMTPELLGVIGRIGRRGGSVDAVRSAQDAVAKLHPLARVLIVADGVVTSGDIIQSLASAGHDTIVICDPDDHRYERVSAKAAWAGLALLDGKRVAEVAAMPRDYDFQSTLLRVAAQAGAEQVRLDPRDAPKHAIERSADALTRRGTSTVAALVAKPVRWAERFLLAPLVRLSLPPLMARLVPTLAPLTLAGALSVAALGVIVARHPVIGLMLAAVALVAASVATALGWVREENRIAAVAMHARSGIVALVVLAIGVRADPVAGTSLAGGLIVAGALLERAALPALLRRWWASPAAYLVILLPLVVIGWPLIGLAAAGLYAAGTLAAAIEAFRQKP
ncbi:MULTISPECIES: hypothetical protein [unclassified Sphingomonas]|uniref:hypothetical protein n=1 Tax=unclassified Sphingomonas TaxID=196159 RepID=UPI001F5AD25A|nr:MULTISPECIES: hypothetical protein [unclassified Sphingomonas]